MLAGSGIPTSRSKSSGHLSAALNQMARNGRACDSIMIIPVPAELRHTRRDGQAWISDAAGNHNVRARFNASQWLRAEISTGVTNEPKLSSGVAGLEVREQV
jgi:hypothetical protein